MRQTGERFLGTHERERIALLRLYAVHPHCFGTMNDTASQNASVTVGAERYERIVDIGYDAWSEHLSATVVVARPIPSFTEPARAAQRVHVRFFIDQGIGWESAGVATLDPPELFAAAAGDGAEPRSLRHTVSFGHRLRRGRLGTPEIRVRVILSCGAVPPAEDPLWKPVWGHVSARTIALHPRYAAPTLQRRSGSDERSRRPQLAVSVGGRGPRDESEVAVGSNESMGMHRRPAREGRSGVGVGMLQLLGRATGEYPSTRG